MTGPSMTESELIELAARAIQVYIAPHRTWEEIGPVFERRNRELAQAALTAINLPQMLEVVAAARRVVAALKSADACQHGIRKADVRPLAAAVDRLDPS